VHSHGAQGSYASGVPRLSGLYGAIRGFTVLALNRRDWGTSAGGGDTLFEDATRDLGVGVDFLERLGFDKVFIGGHSQGTTNAGVYPGYVPDSRLVAVGLYGTVSDARISAENVVFAGLYADHVVTAQDLVSQGEVQAHTVVGWDTAFGQQVFRSPRTWLSYYGPDTLAVPEREITASPVPVLLLRAQGDLFTIGPWSVAVRDAAVGAGVDATYTVLPYPETTFDPGFFGGNAHGFAGIERELITATLDWLRPRVPEVDEFVTNIAFPQSAAGNYPPYAVAGPDVEPQAASATLDGRRSQDIDGTLTYRWSQLDGPALAFDDPASPTPTVTTAAYGVSAATLRLTVTDDAGASATDDVVVTLDGGAAPAPDSDPSRTDSGGSSFGLLALVVLALAAARRR
jgi:pimeloyl-ACP methyl ester carboxylesterase